MTDIENYQRFVDKQATLDKKLESVRQSGTAQDYADVLEEIQINKDTIKQLYKPYRLEQFRTCDHLSGVSYSTCDYDYTRIYFKCVKCGLDEAVLANVNSLLLPECSDEDMEIMSEFFLDTACPVLGFGMIGGIKVGNTYYDDMAELYNKMKEENPNLSDTDFMRECVEKLCVSKDYLERVREREKK